MTEVFKFPKVILGDICDDCKHKSSQTLYSATCTDGYNKDKPCLEVTACDNYSKIVKDK